VRAWLLAVGAVLTVLTWHGASLFPHTGLDNSWQIGLTEAASHGLDFGHDVVFTYGPLGFLSVPLLGIGHVGWLALAFAIIAQLVLAVVVLARATRLYGIVIGVVVAFLALGLTLLVSDVIAYLAFFAAVWLLDRDEPPSAWWVVPAAGVAAAFELLVKLNGGILCLVLFALAVWRVRGLISELLLAVSFCVSVVVLWVASRNSLAALPDWLRESRHVVGSYTQAMVLDPGNVTGESVLAAVLVAAGIVLLSLHLRGLPRARATCLGLVAAAFTYAYAKEGFVRHEVTHVLWFFGAFAVAALAFRWRGALRWAAAALVLGAVVGSAVVSTPYERHYGRIFSGSKDEARGKLGVPASMVRQLRGHTVDSVPYETSAVWAYDLRWRPEPLLQWYLAYDEHLDAFNAARVRADRVLVRRVAGTDDEVLAFQAPATYLALLCHYRELAANGSWEVLARAPNRCGAPRSIGTARFAAGETVTVPAGNGLIVAHIRLRRSAASRVVDALLKPFSVPHVTLGGARYRLAAGTASGPLVLREPAAAGRSPFFGGYTPYDSFTLDRPATIELDEIPIQPQRVSFPVAKAPPLAPLHLVPGAYQAWVDVARRAGSVGALAGWSTAPKIAVYSDGKLVALVGTGQAREDVERAIHVRNTGYSLYFPLAGRRRVRVFAVGPRGATEANYPPDYPWTR
jgi:hypothetical protein